MEPGLGSAPCSTLLPVDLELLKATANFLSNKSTWDPIRINQEVVENKISGPSSDQQGQRPHVTRIGQLRFSKWNMSLDSAGSE